MLSLPAHHRYATLNDDAALAEFVNMAGEGLPLYLWGQLASADQSPWDIGRERARRESGSFSYRNAVIREENNLPLACLIGYPLEDTVVSANYADMPAMFVPMQQLEDEAPGTWYVNVLASYPEHRGKGFGTALLEIAEDLAVSNQKHGLSIIVADSNINARRLYEHMGYREGGRRPMVKEQWENPGREWVLLVKSI